MAAKGSKLSWLLMLQAWTMLWVVIGHSPLQHLDLFSGIDSMSEVVSDVLYRFAYSFHMPLFVMISGYLFYMTRIGREGFTWSKVVRDKLVRLGIPYIVFITLALVLKLCLPGDVDRTIELTPWGIISGYIYPYYGPLREMWFIGAIMIYFCLFPIYKYLLRDKWVSAAVLAVAFFLTFIPQQEMSYFMGFAHAVHNFFFFFLGLVISRYRLDDSIATWGCVLGSAVAMALCFVFPFSFGTKLFGSLTFWGMAIIVDRRLTGNFFSSFSNYTYQIFLIGIFVQMLVKVVFKRFYFTGSYPVFFFLCVILGLYVPVILSKIIEKTDNKYLKMLCGL